MYVIVWEFIIREECTAAFEATYGPRGEWARLFARGQGYCGTRLLHDVSNPVRYVTLDHWESREAHAGFQRQYEREYQALDERCQRLTVKETEIGVFEEES